MRRSAILLVTLIAVYTVATVLLGWTTSRWAEVVYFLTGLILIWYTWETREVRRATLQQTALQIRPLLAIEYGEDLTIWVHNIGKGVARDIQCQNVPLVDNVGPGDRIITVHWKPVDFLREGQKQQLIPQGEIETGEERTKFAQRVEAWLEDFGPRGHSRYEFILDYADLIGKRRRTMVKVNQGHTEVIRDDDLEGA